MLPPHVNVPFMNRPTNQGLDPGRASCPPATLAKPSFFTLSNWLSPHMLLAMHFTRNRTLLELDPFLGHLSIVENVIESPVFLRRSVVTYLPAYVLATYLVSQCLQYVKFKYFAKGKFTPICVKSRVLNVS